METYAHTQKKSKYLPQENFNMKTEKIFLS